jgi:metal-responsive CopG/Arc/MetJ family transcriptional regulator
MRNKILGIRMTEDSLQDFDRLCDPLSHRRSEVIRYCLKSFLNRDWSNEETIREIRAEFF